MVFQQFYLGCLAQASYLIGDEGTGIAAVVDPRRDIDEYLAYATEHRLRIAHVLLTHFHADFVAGHLELRDRLGAAIYLGAAAQAEYPFQPLRDGDTVDFGKVRLQAFETPGHTAESISLLVFDLAAKAVAPYAVLTGDTLFVGDVGRPDLRVALGWSALELGGLLYDSLHAKLLTLPDASLVYPAHGAGSLCGKALGSANVSTIGEQRQTNYALQPMSRAAFIELVTVDQPDAPPYFTFDAVLNTKQRPTLSSALTRELQPLSLERVLELRAAGAKVVDTRDACDFAAGHLAGSVNIGLNGQFAIWAGTLLDREQPIVIVANPGSEAESLLRLGRIGFDNAAGYLRDGQLALRHRSELIVATERISPQLAADRLAGLNAPQLIDVRTLREHNAAHIEGSHCIPLNHLMERLGELPVDRALLIHCASGYRSSVAASLLQRGGISRIAEMAGGMTAWKRTGLPVVRSTQ